MFPIGEAKTICWYIVRLYIEVQLHIIVNGECRSWILASCCNRLWHPSRERGGCSSIHFNTKQSLSIQPCWDSSHISRALFLSMLVNQHNHKATGSKEMHALRIHVRNPSVGIITSQQAVPNQAWYQSLITVLHHNIALISVHYVSICSPPINPTEKLYFHTHTHTHTHTHCD